jgi:large subunit ribosomal protein L15
VIRLHNLQPRPGSRHRVKRLGIGESSGHGKTSGKGHKGQKARSGGSIRLGFEGGQMPLIRRLPKRGFNNAAFKKQYALINLDDLNEFKAGTVINEELLRESKHIRGKVAGLKVLGRGELKHSLTVEADRVSESARQKIEKAGGTVTLRERSSLTSGKRSQTVETKQKTPAPAVAKAKAKAKKPAAKKKKTAE